MRSLRHAPLALALLLAACAASPQERLAEAQASMAAHDYSAAQTGLAALLKEDPGNRAAALLLAAAQVRLNDADGALGTLDRLGPAAKDAPGAVHLRAEALLIKGQPRATLALLGADASAEGLRIRANALVRDGRAAEAIDLFEQGLRDAPSVRLAFDYGRLQVLAGNPVGAARVLEALRKVAPGSYEALLLEGDLAVMTGQSAAALEAFAAAAAKAPSRPEPLLAQAQVLELADRPAEAVTLVDKAAELPVIGSAVGATRLRLAAVQGQWDKVVAQLQSQESMLAPESADGLLYAEALLRVGRPEQARAMLVRVLQLQPGNLHVRRLAAEAELATGDAARALEQLGPLLEVRYPERPVLELAVKAAQNAGDPAAGQFAARLGSADYRAYESHAKAADAAALKDDWATVAASLRAMLALDGDARGQAALADALLRAGDMAGAIVAADAALALAPQDPGLLHLAAMARLRAGREANAAADLLRRGLVLDPRNLDLIVALKTAEAAAG
ncbi:MAG: tetratricopeptide repeat protein [Novosphingobium sp.]